MFSVVTRKWIKSTKARITLCQHHVKSTQCTLENYKKSDCEKHLLSIHLHQNVNPHDTAKRPAACEQLKSRDGDPWTQSLTHFIRLIRDGEPWKPGGVMGVNLSFCF